MMPNKQSDVIIIGAGHNGLVAAIFLSRAGFNVTVLEQSNVIGGAVRTEYPFRCAPQLGASTGAYLLGLMPPELIRKIGVHLPLIRRDPHYFLPTTSNRYLLFGSDQEAMRQQFHSFFSEADWRANQALQAEIGKIRADIAPTWLEEPLSIEDTAERYVRPDLNEIFIRLCRGTVEEYLNRFNFKSDLIKAMYAVTDAFSGLYAGWETPGSGMNFLIHNMCRLPESHGTWMIAKGGMGMITQSFADEARRSGAVIRTECGVKEIDIVENQVRAVHLTNGEKIRTSIIAANCDPFEMRALVGTKKLPSEYNIRLDQYVRPGSTFKVNLCLKHLPKFNCLSEDKGQYGTTIHLLPDEDNVIAQSKQAFKDVQKGCLPDFPSIEWYIHTGLDPSLRDDVGRHNGALFVQWVPYTLREGSWEDEEERYTRHLLSVCDRFAPGTSDLVEETFALTPPKIEQYFGITQGHIHHIDNTFGFADRLPYRTPVSGLYSCSAGCHPAGSVIGAAGHNAAQVIIGEQA